MKLRWISASMVRLFAAGVALSCLQVANAQTGPFVDTIGGTVDATCPVAGPGDLRVTINVPDVFTIGDVNLGLIATHAFRSDLQVFLEAPDGTRQELLTGPQNTGADDYNILLDDEGVAGAAPVPINTGAQAADNNTAAAPFEFTVAPENPLSVFDGIPANGDWFVDYCDTFPGADDGTILRTELLFEVQAAPTDADLALTLAPAQLSPTIGTGTFIDITVQNNGPAAATGVSASFPLPSGLVFLSDDGGGGYNSVTGVWTIGSIAAGASVSLRVVAQVQAVGSHALLAEITSSNGADPDSTPGNAAINPGEDDTGAVTLTPVSPPPPLFCLGRPIQPLAFQNPVAETPGADINAPQVNDVFRFPNVSPGVDALVRVTSFNNGASLITIDNDAAGVQENFQPTLLATAAGDVSVDFEITIVSTGTSIPGTLDFAGSAIDVDGDNGALTEYVEVSDNIVEFALNGVFTPAPATRIISQATTPPDAAASAPSAGNRVRFEAATSDVAAGIDPNEPRNIVAAFFTDVSVFEYRIGKLGGATGAAGRLNSLAFNCPNITPTVTQPVALEDFGDAPLSFGNPIHVIQSGIQLGATNTDEAGPGDSADASSDAGDDGVILPADFVGGETRSVTVNVQNTTGSPAFLQTFFDWNGDGDFEDAGEQVVSDVEDSDGDGIIPLTIIVPLNTVGGTSFARFRWSLTSGLGVQDPVSSGEVEDYQITLTEALPADVSLDITASPPNPFLGDTTVLAIRVSNDGPEPASGIIANISLLGGVTFLSSDAGLAFDLLTGNWTLPGIIAPGDSVVLNITASVDAVGTFTVSAEIIAADRPDLDSTPASGPGEDDFDTVDLVVAIPPVGAPVCPAGLVLVSQIGNAVNVTVDISVGSQDSALGPLSAPGGIPDSPGGGNTISAELNAAGDLLVLDLGVLVPENATITLSLARDGGAAGDNVMAAIGVSDSPAGFVTVLNYGVNLDMSDAIPDFVSAAQDVLETVVFTAPAGGVQFIEFDTLNGDDLFVDGVLFGQACISGGELEGSKTVTVFDPLGEGLFAVPGNDVIYTINVRNIGGGATDADSIFLIDELPPEVIFFNGDADGPGPGTDPVLFTETVPTVTLEPFVFANDVGFLDGTVAPTDFASCTYIPVAGYDPAVRFICFNPKGVLASGTPSPEFALQFRARIR